MSTKWIEEMAVGLGLGSLDPLDPADTPVSRPKGYDSAKIVRELRNQKFSSVSASFE